MSAKYPHVVKAEKYAKAVVSGEILACEWVILACKRHFDDKEKAKSKAYEFKFDRAKGERICKFISRLPHVKGKWARNKKTISLEPWQCFLLVVTFGWVEKKTGFRRFRKALWMIPRKNAKSTIAAGTGLYMLTSDNEYGAEVYAGATSEKQAFEVFRPAKQMAQKAEQFVDYFGVELSARNIAVPGNGSRFEPIIGQPGDGASPSLAIHDEYHEHPTDEQVATMETGMGAREQPLQLFISTAGDNLAAPCYALCKEGQKVLKGDLDDARFFFIYYTIDKDDDWTSESALIKANPNLDVSVDKGYLSYLLHRAIQVPRAQSRYKTKSLNVWVGSMNAYFNTTKWRNASDDTLKLEDFEGRDIWVGLDLSSKVDLAALEILIPIDRKKKTFVRFGKYYLPEATVYDTDENEHYRGWSEQGYITVTDGEIIDYDSIRDDLDYLSSRFSIQCCAYDPFQATYLATSLIKEGYPMEEYRPLVINFSESMKEIDALIRSESISHNGDPVMEWAMGNVVAKEDKKDNVYPNKEGEKNKIDPAVALIMAMGSYMSGKGPKKRQSVYNTQDLVSS